ncbi:MAG: FeoA family protein [Thomasclavelia sp.]|jgi:ferrous iron transport protein A|nr:FeoA family protein [Thomasclavelia sp.]
MPLAFASINDTNTILNVGGNIETKHHLENLGFVTGSEVTIINKVNENIIVSIKNTRVALSKELANKISV